MTQNGSVFLTIFGAIAMVGVLAGITTSLIKGPVTTMARVTDHTLAKNDMMANAILLSEATLKQVGADCDGDGSIEPLPYRTATGSAPVGGGWVPSNIGASTNDPWKQEYGYCVWDHGSLNKTHAVAACGGAGASRLNGTTGDKEIVIALISAGPNKQFETTCRAWVDADHDGIADAPLAEAAPNSDDIVRVVPYGQFMMPSSAQAKLGEMPDAACTAAAVGLLRIMLGVVQVCTNTGWMEIAPASGGDLSFAPVTNAVISSTHQSNLVTFGTLSTPQAVSVSGGATLSINGGAPVTSGTIQSGNTLRLTGTAGNAPEVTRSFTVQIGAVTKLWQITTRDAYIGNIVMTPILKDSMTVTGPGAPAYGATVGFVVTNTGERATGPLNAAVLSNPTHFAFNNTGGYVGDSCAGKTLRGTIGGAQSCVIDVRPKATNDSSGFQGTLSIGDGMLSASATLSGSASGWSCPLPWGGQVANGGSVVAFATACSLLSCTSQVRACSNGTLSGSFQHQTCNVLLSCL